MQIPTFFFSIFGHRHIGLEFAFFSFVSFILFVFCFFLLLLCGYGCYYTSNGNAEELSQNLYIANLCAIFSQLIHSSITKQTNKMIKYQHGPELFAITHFQEWIYTHICFSIFLTHKLHAFFFFISFQTLSINHEWIKESFMHKNMSVVCFIERWSHLNVLKSGNKPQIPTIAYFSFMREKKKWEKCA